MGNRQKYSDKIQKDLDFDDFETTKLLFGDENRNLKKIGESLNISLTARGSTVHISGDSISVELSENLLIQLNDLIAAGHPVYPKDIDEAIRMIRMNGKVKLKDVFLDKILVTSKKKTIAPKNPAQKEYIDAVRKYDIVFSIGPAGTGKTYLAMAMAVSELTKGTCSRIILTRPAVEAGESLGFLPGDLAQKVDPYLRPLYDALHDMMPYDKITSLMEQGVIEVAPLAFMRGRTLNHSFIILDEAQNTTSEQMKMFLTRIGFNSKAVITGDITQVDLPSGKGSGLIEAEKILKNIKGIRFSYFSKKDVVRHKLVMKIISAYEKKDKKRNS